MIIIDGSQGEGGGQILRSSLALSLVTETPFRIINIRANRSKPGLMRQHLTAVEAAVTVGSADVEGASIGSRELAFAPHGIKHGEHRFSVGTAGSATLVLQTVLPALLLASGPSTLTLDGGTHNPWAPPFDFLKKVFVPLINRMGPEVAVTLERHGFYPAGGGRFHVQVTPAAQLAPIELKDRGAIHTRRARALLSALPRHIAERELNHVRKRLNWDGAELLIEDVHDQRGPGNVVLIEVESEHVTEVFTGFGEMNVRAETVADRVAVEAARYIDSGVPVGEHLADQLLLPLALAGGGAFLTLPLTPHSLTNIDVIKQFLEVETEVHAASPGTVQVSIRKR